MTDQLRIKVCGMRDTGNITDLVGLGPDYIGFILFPGSKRYLGDDYILEAKIPSGIKRVGVFVDELVPKVISWINRLELDFVQLHGNEPPEYCRELFLMQVKVIKAFGVDQEFDFKILEDYLPYCDYFLFDTRTEIHGGSGKQFDWKLLENYTYNKPFFLSGGIGAGDIQQLKGIRDLPVHALDINSRFELGPALKDIPLVGGFIKNIRAAGTV